jgi:hypothetical protein
VTRRGAEAVDVQAVGTGEEPQSRERRMRFKLRDADEDFLRSAPHPQVAVFQIPQPADRVWAQLIAEDALSWCRALTGVAWTSPRPFGVGATRTVTARPRALALNQVYFRWDEGRQKSHRGDVATVSSIRRELSDRADLAIELQANLDGRERRTAGGAARNPINALITRSLFRDTKRHFDAS